VRTVTVTAESVSEGPGSGTITVNITPENDPPIGSPVSVEWENTPADDTFADITGTVSFVDPDNTSLAYTIVGGTPGTYNVGGIDYDHQLIGTYGTTYIVEATGAFRIVADDPAVEAVSIPVVEEFSITASDGAAAGTTTISLGIQLPPAPRNVVGTPGNAQVTVTWDQPTETTGITGYVATASPGGQTCSTVGVGSTSCIVMGLTNGTAYTFTVTPTTESGQGTISLPSDAVTPVGPPGAPISVIGTPGTGRVLVSWDPPVSDGGGAITAYTVSSSPGGGSCSTTGATNCTVLGLALGVTYTFTVHATNANGDGPESAPIMVTIKNETTTSLAVDPALILEGESATLTATVTGGLPTGTVEFFDGATSLGTSAVSAGSAVLVTSAFGLGSRSLTAEYSGDGLHTGSTSDAAPLTVMPFDTDGDRIVDDDDNCPLVANGNQNDFDGDGMGNRCDDDDDNDGVLDVDDPFPWNPDRPDADGDGVGNAVDNCPAVKNRRQKDFDGDGMGNRCDPDKDGDGVDNGLDAFPWNPARS
jgi:hypothetical protein